MSMDQMAYDYMVEKTKQYDIYTKEIKKYEDILAVQDRNKNSRFYLNMCGNQVLTPPEVQEDLTNIVKNSIIFYRSLRDAL